MTFRRLSLAVVLVAAPAVAATAEVFAQAPSAAPAVTLLAVAGPRSHLASSYRVSLRSAWPALPAAANGCGDPGSESLEGTLTRAGETRYEGRFVRTSILRFCGPHGAAANAPCSGALEGEGVVRVIAEVTEGRDGRPTMTVEWRPVADGTRVSIRGDCPARFGDALGAMYRSAVHGVDFDLPASAGEPRQLALDDYGWVLDIE